MKQATLNTSFSGQAWSILSGRSLQINSFPNYLSSVDVWAASESAKPDVGKCSAAYEQCYAQCREENPAQTLEGDTARAGCGSICVAKRTACLAGKEYDKAKPWVTDQMKKFNEFLDNFFKGPPETPAPPKGDGMKNI